MSIDRRTLLARTGALLGVTLPAVTNPAWASDTAFRITGTGSGTGGMQVMVDAYSKQPQGQPGVVLPALGSSGGIKALLDGKIDIAITNRPPRSAEAAQAPLKVVPYARTPFVVAVHRELGVEQLTLAQLIALYGEGAPTFPNGKRARPVLRFSDATDTNLLKSLSPQLAAALDAASSRKGMLDAGTDSEAADLIERTSGAFGASTLALIESERRPLRALALDGVAPTLANLAAGRWKMHKPLLFVTRAEPSAAAQRFIDFALSASGQALLATIGHGAT